MFAAFLGHWVDVLAVLAISPISVNNYDVSVLATEEGEEYDYAIQEIPLDPASA